MKKIAIAIINWNGIHLLKEFLPTVISFSNEAEIYLIDNNSTDLSIAYIEQNFSTVKIIKHPENYGYAKGYNLAIPQIKESYVCLLNNDVAVTENWLKPIINLFEGDNFGIIQPKILDYKNPQQFEYAGAAGGYLDKFGYPYCKGRIFETIENDTNQYDSSEVFWVSGACFFINREVFFKLGGFDEDFFAHQEEIDLCWRAQHEGYKIFCETKCIVYHLGGGTLSAQSTKKTFLNFRNNLCMLTKNLPTTDLFPIIFSRLLLDGIAGLRFIMKGEWQHCVSIIKAHLSYYQLMCKMIGKRPKKCVRKYHNHQSIIFNYFIKKQKKYLNLS